MSDIVARGIDDDFVRRAKAYAALSGLNLKSLVILALEQAMTRDIEAPMLETPIITTPAFPVMESAGVGRVREAPTNSNGERVAPRRAKESFSSKPLARERRFKGAIPKPKDRKQ